MNPIYCKHNWQGPTVIFDGGASISCSWCGVSFKEVQQKELAIKNNLQIRPVKPKKKALKKMYAEIIDRTIGDDFRPYKNILHTFRDLLIDIDGVYHIKCIYCDHFYPYHKMTVDHVVPKKFRKKGEHCRLLPACRGCNADKKDMTYSEFIKSGLPQKRNELFKKFINGNSGIKLLGTL